MENANKGDYAMEELVRCKSCGFVMRKGKLKDQCPACGVGAKMFEDYIEKISHSRKLILSLDLHPVLVHFPQAFIVSIFVLTLTAILIQGPVQEKIIAAITVMGMAMPVMVFLSFCAGLLDGKIRFRKFTTPILKKKIVFGAIFFAASCAMSAIILISQLASVLALAAVGAVSLIALGCAVTLGMLGASILNAKFPG